MRYIVNNPNIPPGPIRWIWELEKLALKILGVIATIVLLIVLIVKLC